MTHPLRPLTRLLLAAATVMASLTPAVAGAAGGFASTQPTARVEYWQQRQTAIDRQLADKASLGAFKLLLVGDSITDFWLLGDDPWIPGRLHGRPVWDESFGSNAAPQNRAFNIGISGDRTEHLLYRILPARLLPQSILPTAEPARDAAVVQPVNARLAALARSPEWAAHIVWLDLYPAFLNADGQQDKRLFVDGLHPSEAGYRVWRDRLVPALAAARGR